MKNTYKIVFIFLGMLINSCVKDNDFTVPKIEIKEPNIKPTNSLKSIINMYKGYTVDFSQNKSDLIISGYIISSDESSNIYKTLTIQDKPKNPTAAIQLSVDAVKLYTYFDVGRKIYVKLKGLGLHSKNGVLEIGTLNKGSVERISSSSYRDIIIRSTEVAKIEPLPLESISDISDKYINMLIQLKDIHSVEKDLTYANINYSFPVNRILESCSDRKRIILRNSGYATYKGQSIPNKRGKITAILGKYNSDYQLTIRNTNDIDFTEDYNCNTSLVSISKLKELFTGKDIAILENAKIKAVITSDKNAKNIQNNQVFVQDLSTGIAIDFDDSVSLEIGQEIEIFLKNTVLKKVNGLLTLSCSKDAILSEKEGKLPQPKQISLIDALSGKYESELVEIKGVQFDDTNKNYLGDNFLTDNCTQKLKLVVRNNAIFADDKVNNNRGSVIGIISKNKIPVIYLQNKEGIQFTKPYVNCNSSSTVNSNLFDFEDIEKISTSYKSSGSLIASDGTKLIYQGRTNLGKYAINKKGIMLKSDGFITITFLKGVKKCSFKFKGAFTSSTNREIIVLEGNKTSSKEIIRKTFNFNSSTQKLELELNKTSSYTITIKSGNSKQVVIDDIQWNN